MFNAKGTTMRFLLILITVCFLFTGCKFIQINPSTDQMLYETLGGNIGAYLKARDPALVAKVAPHIKTALAMSNEELISENVLQVAYEYALKSRPDDAEFILLVKSTIDIFGVRLDASLLFPEEIPKYLLCVKSFLKGYSGATKVLWFDAISESEGYNNDN